MAQKGKRVCLQVEWIEPKQLLSSSLMGGLAQTPVLTMFRYSSTLAGVENALGTVAKTQDFSQLDASLATLSAPIPYGQQLLSQWKDDLNTFDPNIRGSGLAMQRQLLSDTVAYVQNGVTEGLFRVIGRGASVFYQGDDNPFKDWKRFEIYRDPSQGWTEYDFAAATVTNLTGENVAGVQVRASVSVSGETRFYPPESRKLLPLMAKDSTTLLYLAYNGNPNSPKKVPPGALFTFTLDFTKPPPGQLPLLMQNIPFAGRYNYDSFKNGTAEFWKKRKTDLIQKYDLTAVRNKSGVIIKYVLTLRHP